MGTGSFPGVKSGRGETLTPHRLLVLWSRKGRTACTEPHSLYNGALYFYFTRHNRPWWSSSKSYLHKVQSCKLRHSVNWLWMWTRNCTAGKPVDTLRSIDYDRTQHSFHRRLQKRCLELALTTLRDQWTSLELGLTLFLLAAGGYSTPTPSF